jgi:hypothetical protein
VDLDLRLRIIHGKETVVEETGDLVRAARDFRRWVLTRGAGEPRVAAV